MNTPHPVVALIGPSASGKSSVVRELHRRGVVDVRPTWTTRPRRADETDGSVEHRFVTDDEFDALARARFFVDTVAMFGLPYRYGLPGPLAFGVARPEIVLLRAPLVERFRRLGVDCTVVQIEDSPARTAARLAQRNMSAVELQARLVDNERELVAGRAVADVVFSNVDSIGALADRIAAVAA